MTAEAGGHDCKDDPGRAYGRSSLSTDNNSRDALSQHHNSM